MRTRPLPTWGRLVAVAVAAALSLLSPAARALTLVQDGKAQAVLVVAQEVLAQPGEPTARRKARTRGAPSPLQDEQQAAMEIQSYVERISGAKLDIAASGEDLKRRKPIYIGSAAEPALDDVIKAKGTDLCGFALVVKEDSASLRGLSPAGTFCGACELLEQLGVRWFLPGELGTVIPQARTVTLRNQETVQVPSFPSRHLQAVEADWARRLRAGGPQFPASHGVHLGEQANALFAAHPEYFALRGGKRSTSQLCISNDDVLKLAIQATRQFFRDNPAADIIGMGANDGRGFCECENCRKLDGGDYDPFGHTESMTDRYIWFFNKVLEGIKDEFPAKRIGFYAYASYCRPPVKVKPDSRIVPAVAMITLCRMHGMDNPICPEKSYEKWIIEQWGKIVPQVYYRGYWFNLADPGLPFFMIRRIAQEVPLGKKLGVAGWRTECLTNWAGNSPSLYIALKLMWDHTAKPDDILADFGERFFGPAAKPMLAYIDLMDRTVDQADHHAGSIWDMAQVYPPAFRAGARRLLDEAARTAPSGSIYAQRVAMYGQSVGFLDGFADVMDGRASCDFALARKGLDSMTAMREALWAYQPAMIGKKAEDYTNRYLTDTVVQGLARTTGGNRLLAALKDQWQFQIDPEKVGEMIGLFEPAVTGGSWQLARTSTRSWSDQGLRYYKGLAWYRQTVDIPAEAKDKRVFLWFGGIDELAKVWVNGKCVGISPRLVFKPFELDATDAIQPGKPNVVVVCISNEQLNELGTGGIVGPVLFYLPAAGKDAKLQNSRDLGKTFPEY